jgi:signal transduction histidine kinase
MFRTHLMIFGFLMMGLIVVVGGMSQWAAYQFHHQLERSKLAHTVRAEFLKLTAQMYPLFEQLLDPRPHAAAALDDDSQLARLRQDIEATTDRIRTLIATEVAHTGSKEDELAELHQLAHIERDLYAILKATERALRLRAQGRLQEAEVAIAEIVSVRINQHFMQHMQQTLDEESREVVQTDRDGNALLNRLTYTTITGVAIAMMLGLGGIVILRRRLYVPIQALMKGTQALADGDLDFRMTVAGRDEFARIAHRFNEMAEQLQQNQHLAIENQQGLERRVDERTEQLKLAYEALNRADEVRRQFFADISHELRTPLTVIRGEAQFSLRGADKGQEDYKDTLKRIANQADQIGRLLDDLLFIARVDGGAPRLIRTAVALDQLLEAVCLDAQAIANDKAIYIDLRIEKAQAIVSGDNGRLRQMFLILLDNAVRYSQPEATVTVWLGADQRGFTVEVRDNGLGICAEELELIFARFYRGSNTGNANVEGLGLGLPMAKAIVVAHGGEISVQSVVDQGTVVAVSFPIGVQEQIAS